MRFSIFSLAILLCAIATTGRGQRASEMKSVKDAYLRYPERIEGLFRSLDLSYPGLEKVRQAVASGNAVAAGEELLAYYRNAVTTGYLRREQPSESSATNSEADSIVNDLFVFYDLPARVPRTASGSLDWTYKGPDNDIEWAWGLNRHGHLISLMEAYFETGNPVYARQIDAHLQDWVINSLPYPGVKSSTPQWRGLEVALRAKVWVRIFFALVNSDYLSPATKILLMSSLPEHTHYMQNFHAPAGNWLTMEMSGLAMVATAWPEFKQSREWVSYAKKNMLEGLKDQVYADGVQKELTSHYHQVAWYNFDHFREICQQAGEPLPDDYTKTLEKMQHYTASTVRPTGYGILNNDSDKRYNRDHIINAASDYGREDWLFIASNGTKGKRPDGPPSVVFPWAGQMVMRSGYDADAHWAFFDMGPWGTGHQHNDKLHISITAYGRDLLVDGGRFAYRGQLADKFRGYATGSASHNVLLIDGAGQDAGPRVAPAPLSDSDYRIEEQFDYARGEFNQFKRLPGSAKHARSLFYMRDKFWIVVDRIETDRPRKIEALWHWHPDVKVETQSEGIVATNNEKGNLKIIPVGEADWKIRQVKGQNEPSPQGWYSEEYNHAQPSTASIYSTDVKGTTTFVWILQPSKEKVKPLKAQIVSSSDDAVTLRLVDEQSNQWDVTVPISDSHKAQYSFHSSAHGLAEPELNDQKHAEQVKKLLARLDLDKPGMEAIRAAKHDPSKAASALLEYYRKRDNVKHLIDRSSRHAMRGKSADEETLKEAEDAMKHIFIGQGAYPPFYCGDDINWGSRPVPDNEWVWQLNRMGFWEAMARAYWHTGDERYAREWALQLLDWTQKNPRDEAHAYAWRSIEAGIRGHRWSGLFQRFIDSPSFTPAVLVAFLNSCYDHASYLMTKYHKGSNWALMEAEGMGFIAMTFPEFIESEQWRSEAVERLNAEIDNQVYPDGHQRELAMGYHTGSIGWFKRTFDMAAMNGLRDVFPSKYMETIEKMCEIPFKLGLPDGSSTQFGDSWKGQPGRLWPMMKEFATTFDRADFLYVATQGQRGTKPEATAFALPHSGLYSLRSGWNRDAICLVLKCGPDGGGHCQPDNGTFELYAGGRHLMPDAGSYIYSGDPEGRRWFRQTSVHQTMTLDGENSAYAPRQLLWKIDDDLDVLVVENKSYPSLIHRRAVLFVDKKYFVIIDEAIGEGTGDVDIHFQLAPGAAKFDTAALSVRSDFRDGWNVSVRSMPQQGLKLEPEEGWVSFQYTKKEPRPAFRYRLRKISSDGLRFITIVTPYEGSMAPDITAEVSRRSEVGGSRLDLKIKMNGVSRRVRYQIP